MPPRRDLHGFTLIELLACLAIAGVAAVMIAAHARAPREQRLAWAARQIMSELIQAQARAVEEHSPQIAQIDPQAESRRFAGLAPGEAGPASGPAVAAVNFDGQPAVVFDELGMPYSYCPKTRKRAPLSAGSVVLKYGQTQMIVRIVPITGQIQVQ